MQVGRSHRLDLGESMRPRPGQRYTTRDPDGPCELEQIIQLPCVGVLQWERGTFHAICFEGKRRYKIKTAKWWVHSGSAIDIGWISFPCSIRSKWYHVYGMLLYRDNQMLKFFLDRITVPKGEEGSVEVIWINVTFLISVFIYTLIHSKDKIASFVKELMPWGNTVSSQRGFLVREQYNELPPLHPAHCALAYMFLLQMKLLWWCI